MATALRPSEVARALNVSRFTVYDLIKRGDLPAIRVGHQFRIEASAVASYRDLVRLGLQDAGLPAGPSGELLLASGTRTVVLAAPGDLRTLPSSSATAIRNGPNGLERHSYRGVQLYNVLAAQGMLPPGDPMSEESDGSVCEAFAQAYVVARGQDGRGAVFGLAEISPEYGDTQVLIAWERDGQPIVENGPIQLVVPSDRLGGRAIRCLERISINVIE
jgi:excisionase family DNA binding protein